MDIKAADVAKLRAMSAGRGRGRFRTCKGYYPRKR